METSNNKIKKKGKVGYTLTCGLQSKYQDKSNKVRSASITILSDDSPKEIINKIKKGLK